MPPISACICNKFDRQAGVTELEWEDEGDCTGVKVQDPDGYVVELAYDEA